MRVLGPKLGRQLPVLRSALNDLSPELASHIAQAAEAGQSVEIESIELQPGDLLIEVDTDATSEAASAEDERCAVQLSTELTPELVAEGKAREVINRIQGLRRESGLDPDDRISLQMASEDRELKAAVSEFESLIAAETLATNVSVDGADLPTGEHLGKHHTEADIDGAAITLALDRA